LVDAWLARVFAQFSAVALDGPRACGKTTTAKRLVGSAVDLSEPGTAAAFEANPDAALREAGEPVVIDEWQEAPALLGAVKRLVDAGEGGGRFLLTGSADIGRDVHQWPGTGRILDVPIWPMTVREIDGDVAGRLFVERLVEDDPGALQVSGVGVDPPDIGGYVCMALRGGFPEPALSLDPDARALWLEAYTARLLRRDASLIDSRVDPGKLATYFEACCANTAGVITQASVARDVGIDARTARAYEHLLGRLHVTRTLPPWLTNRMNRLTKTPKRYIVDPSLAAATLRCDTGGLMRDADLLGRVIETFVIAQIIPELTVAQSRPKAFHLRDQGGRHEIDLVLEFPGGHVAGIEIKAAAAATRHDARHLEWFRDAIGGRFTAGVVLYAGRHTSRLADKILAAPIATLWS
jgi:predicted AAA+ superfamily ATPase